MKTSAASRALLIGAISVVALALAAAAPASGPSYADWTAPVNLGATLNTTAAERGPVLSPDGLSLYFDSDRPGGSGSRTPK